MLFLSERSTTPVLLRISPDVEPLDLASLSQSANWRAPEQAFSRAQVNARRAPDLAVCWGRFRVGRQD